MHDNGLVALPDALGHALGHIHFQHAEFFRQIGIPAVQTDNDDPVHVRIIKKHLETAIEHPHVAFGRTREVDGVLDGAMRLEYGTQLFLRGLGKHGRFQAVGLAEVRRHNAVPAAVGKDGYALAVGGFALGKGFRRIQQLVGGVDAHHSGLRQSCIKNPFAAGEGTGVRSGGAGSGGTAADLDGGDGLAHRGTAGGFKELAPILLVFHPQPFHIEEHDLGVIILLDIPDKVIEADIHLVADGGPATVAHAALFGVEIQIDAEVAALQHEAHGAGGKVDDARVQADRRTVHPHAVGAHDAHVALAGDLQHPAFDFLAFGTRFAKTGGNDDPGLHALLHALLDDGQDVLGRDGDDGKIHFAGNGQDIGVGRLAEDFAAGTGNQMDFSLKLVVDQAFGRPVAVFLGVRGSTNERYAFGTEQRNKVGHDALHISVLCDRHSAIAEPEKTSPENSGKSVPRYSSTTPTATSGQTTPQMLQSTHFSGCARSI